MNGLAVALVFLASGVETTWETTPQGDRIYVVQLDDQAIEALRAGHPITSVLPSGLDRVGAVRLQYGSQALHKPALFAESSAEPEVAQVANVASLAMLQQIDNSQPPNLLNPADAFARNLQAQSGAAPNTVDRGLPLQPTFAGGAQNLGIPAAADSLPIRVSPEAREWSDIAFYATAPLVQGFDYQTGSSRPATPPPVAPTNPGGWTSQANNTPVNTTPVGATQWDSGRNTSALDVNGNYPRNPSQTQVPFPGTQVPAQQTGSALQLGLGGQGLPQWTNSQLPNSGLQPPPIPGQFPYASNNAGTTSPFPPNYNGNTGIVPPQYQQTQPPYAPTNPTQSPTLPSSGSGNWWVNTQGSDASPGAGQSLANSITRTNYPSTASLGTSGSTGTRLTSRSQQLANQSTTDRSGSSTTVPRDTDEREAASPEDASVAALGLLFLSIGLNVYFGYLIRGFYLKTRQLARDLRESIITT